MRTILKHAAGFPALLILALLAIASLGWADDSSLANAIEPLDPPRDYLTVEGDIMVTKEFWDNRHNKAIWSSNFWSGYVIPYTIHSSTDATRDSLIHVAFDNWERVCDVQFIPRSGHDNYIRVIPDSNVNSSFIGPQGGRQDVKIATWRTMTICHELYHAMGFWHEQSRADRDNYVEIVWDNIEEDKEHNFEIHASGGYIPNRYDFRSIMHYPPCAFDVGDCSPADCCSTIVMRPGYEEFAGVIGQRARFSHIDSLCAKFLYCNHPDWSFTATRFAADFGTFANPYHSWQSADMMMPVGDTLWLLEGPHIEALGTFDKQALIHNVLEQVTVGADSAQGIWFEVNGQIEVHPGGGIRMH